MYTIFAEKVYGVAQLANIIYVLCDQPVKIFAFSADTYEHQPLRERDIQVRELKQPADIVACDLYRRLYIADCDAASPGCVWQVHRPVDVGSSSGSSGSGIVVVDVDGGGDEDGDVGVVVDVDGGGGGRWRWR